ncbi:MAG: hypothetical protein M3Q48_16570 [Actinomycetota bacterium]|nr:hypothetical protein [Actinomycetota bacterium]
MVEVRVGAVLAAALAREYGPERTAEGWPSEWDFWTGPLAAALVAFRGFDALRYDPRHPEVRSVHVVDPVFGPVVFVGVRVEPGVVELAAYEPDPGYWDLIGEDPDD